MSPNDILDMFQGLVDDAPDADGAQVLMDIAYTERNESRFWQMLMKLDSSISHLASDDWTTLKALPTDFGRPFTAFGGDSNNPYEFVPFEDALFHKGASNKVTVDIANDSLRFMAGSGSTLTFYMWYQYVPTSLIGLSDAQLAATDTIKWPGRFRPLLAFDMAAKYFGGWDADEITRAMTPFQINTAKNLERAMVRWDNANRMKLMGDSAAPRRTRTGGVAADVVDWNV